MRKNLKTLRETRNKTIREVAEDLGVNYSLVSLWEQGKRNPSLGNKKKLVDYYEKPVEFILKKEEV